MHWLSTKFGVGRVGSCCEACQDKPCDCVQLVLNDHTKDLGLELDPSVDATSFPFYFFQVCMLYDGWN